MPGIPDFHRVRGATSEDEHAEAHEHPVERQVSSFADESDGHNRDRETGQRDQRVRKDVQPHQARLP